VQASQRGAVEQQREHGGHEGRRGRGDVARGVARDRVGVLARPADAQAQAERADDGRGDGRRAPAFARAAGPARAPRARGRARAARARCRRSTRAPAPPRDRRSGRGTGPAITKAVGRACARPRGARARFRPWK
jgi:hypothetical protein